MVDELIANINLKLSQVGLSFSQKPIVIGGMAMEYYGIRKSGADIDLVIHDCDYQSF